jgi:hypothetical protein
MLEIAVERDSELSFGGDRQQTRSTQPKRSRFKAIDPTEVDVLRVAVPSCTEDECLTVWRKARVGNEPAMGGNRKEGGE